MIAYAADLRKCHGAHAEKERIYETNTPERSSRSPENHGGQEAGNDEVGILYYTLA